jgi:hypothetical protein
MPNFILLITIFLLTAAGINGQHSIRYEVWQKLVPSELLPKEIKPLNGNNNIDAIIFKDRYFVAFRTAPSHFASRKTKIYVMSSKDFKNWEFETCYKVGADMREPRFAAFRDSLFFYFFEGGTNMFRFQPRKVWMSCSSGNKKWTEKFKLEMDGYVPWRFRVRNDSLYLSAYYGVDIYKNHNSPDLRLFLSRDGKNFNPISGSPQVAVKGAEEGEFEFDKDGNLWATVRLEGSGSYIAYATKDSLENWKKIFGKHKYDSALMLNHKETIYVFARRHLKGEATKTEFPNKAERRKNLIRYSLSKKKTAMYRLNKEKMILEHLFDFPSTGDNAFPAIAKINENQYYLLNYSNDIHKRDLNWISGQLKKTNIYFTKLTIE